MPQLSPLLLLHLTNFVFVFCFGACVGSFINVVIYRLPAGMSVISPPSRCPACGALLRFFRENLPILGWFLVRGKCRYCSARVSPQYMFVELFMALAFVGLYALYFLVTRDQPWWSEIGGPWWTINGVFRVWPVFIAHLFLFAGLFAMTVIDARTFTIPIQIPQFITGTAFIAYPLQSLLPTRMPMTQTWPIPCADWPWTLAAIAGMIGVAISAWRLRTGRVKPSFADYQKYVVDGETLADYPHARREMLVELKFLLPCIMLMVVGYLGGRMAPPESVPPELLQAMGATFLGYLSGAGLIWGIRILGTFVFGREAMGLGDVHLLGCIGAVLGWFDPVWIFFLAPFSGIFWVIWSKGVSTLLRRASRELPYGPHLAVATVIVVLGRPAIDWFGRVVLRGVPLPQPGLVAAPTDTRAFPTEWGRGGSEGPDAARGGDRMDIVVPSADNLTSTWSGAGVSETIRFIVPAAEPFSGTST